MPALPRLAAWLLRISVPERWADSVIGDLEGVWQARLRDTSLRPLAVLWITLESARVAARFAAEGAWNTAHATRRDADEAVRALARQPQFAAAAVLTIAFGSGLNVAAFTIVERILLVPLPYNAPQRLVEVHGRGAGGETEHTVSSIDFESWRDGLAPQLELAAYQTETVHLRMPDDPVAQPIAAAFVTPNLLGVLNVQPSRGRSFDEHDGELGRPGAAVITHHVWQSRFGADPGLVGRAVDIGGRQHTVIGIAPAGTEFPPGVGVWLARETAGARLRDLRIEFASLRVVGRLAGESPVGPTIAEVERRGARLADQAGRKTTPVLIDLHDALVGSTGPALRLAWVAVGFLFLIACANGASLLMARTSARGQELAVRASLGASRLALIRHVAVEGSVLAAVGSVLGLLIATALLRVFEQSEPGSLPQLAGVGLSIEAFAFAAATGVMAAILLGVIPALGAGRNRSLHLGRQAADADRTRRGGGVLVAMQLALCVVLLVGAGVSGWGVLRQVLRDPGFDSTGALIVSVRPETRQASATGGALYGPLLERLEAIDGVTDVAITDHLPPLAAGQLAPIAIEGQPVGGDSDAPVRPIGVTASYFDAMRIPILAGRGFTEMEVASGAPVVVVDSRIAARAGGRQLVGRRLVQHGRVFEVVGIAADAQQGSLGEPPGPTLYRPLSSGVFSSGGMSFLTELHIVIRTAGDASAVAAAVRTALGAPPHVVTATSMATLTTRLWHSLAAPRFHATVLALFALLGAVLAAFGVYGLVSYVVQRSAPEIGLRLALGATRRDVIALVLRRGLGVAMAGAALGLLAAPAVAGAVGSRIDGVAEAGPGVYAGVTTLLLVVVATACALPAWRAAHVDPLVSLRND